MAKENEIGTKMIHPFEIFSPLQKAKLLNATSKDSSSFQFSKGWLDNFKKRYDIKFRQMDLEKETSNQDIDFKESLDKNDTNDCEIDPLHETKLANLIVTENLYDQDLENKCKNDLQVEKKSGLVETEKKLYEWLCEQQKLGSMISGHLILKIAKLLHAESKGNLVL